MDNTTRLAPYSQLQGQALTYKPQGQATPRVPDGAKKGILLGCGIR